MCASRFAGCYAAHMEGYKQVFEAPELHEQLNVCLSESLLVSGTILCCPFITTQTLDNLDFEIRHGRPETIKLDTRDSEIGHGKLQIGHPIP